MSDEFYSRGILELFSPQHYGTGAYRVFRTGFDLGEIMFRKIESMYVESICRESPSRAPKAKNPPRNHNTNAIKTT